MKKLTLLTLIIVSLVNSTSCYFSETKEKQKPVVEEVENNRKYYMKESWLQFGLFTYNVWDLDSFEFDSVMEKRESRLYNIRQKADLGENIFMIKNMAEEKTEYVVKREYKNRDKLDMTYFSIFRDLKDASSDKLAFISQVYPDDNFLFKAEIGDKTYEINKTNPMLNSPVGSVKNIAFALKDDEGEVYCYFLKKFSFTGNIYEIVINSENLLYNDGFYVALCIFVDQVLKENNYYYKYY